MIGMLKKLKKDNRGSSLIEALISMLILAVIVVPLLNNFIVAAKANQRSREMQQATAAASNIMEAVKEHGLLGTARQFNNQEPYSFVYRSPALYQDTTDGLSVTAAGQLNENSDRKYYYTITGATEGSCTFDIKVSFSAGEYDGSETVGFEQNNFRFPDFSAFNSEETLMVNPNATLMDYQLNEHGEYELVASGSFDEKALDYFYDIHDNYYYSLWLDKCAEIEAINQQRLDNYSDAYAAAISSGTALPDYPRMEPEPSELALIPREVFAKDIKRSLNIVLSQNISGKITADASFVYSYDTSTGYCPVGISERVYSGFCSGVDYESIEQLKNIYIFYTYFNKNESGFDTINVDTGDILIPSANKIRLFIAMQQSPDEEAHIPIPVEVNLNSSQFEVYTQGVLGGIYASSYYNEKLYEELEAKDRLYDVTVEIFSENSDFKEESKITELTSTITEK